MVSQRHSSAGRRLRVSVSSASSNSTEWAQAASIEGK